VTKIICGVDVSSQKLDARIGATGPVLNVDRTPEGVGALEVWCRGQGVELVVMEATGGYERLPFSLLWAQDLACAVVNPRSVRRFAEAMGLLEKTDVIDAGVIAWYAQAKGIVGQAPASASQLKLRALVTRLGQLTQLAATQLNQRRLVDDDEVLASINELLAFARAQIQRLERQIAELLKLDPLWKALDAEFRTIKGVADRTVARLMAEAPEIGLVSNKAISKLVGLAPMANDSGKHHGKRRVRGGRTGVRTILFFVAGVVRKHDPDLRAFHQRLLEAGKSKKAIRIALARKLLVRLNAKARDVRRSMAPAA
jgi:transposase